MIGYNLNILGCWNCIEIEKNGVSNLTLPIKKEEIFNEQAFSENHFRADDSYNADFS